MKSVATGKAVAMVAVALACAVAGGTALAQDPEITIIIRNHRFEPADVKVPAGKKIKLIVDNQDATAEEFESKVLNREKVIPPKSKGTVYIGPLKPGKYPFVGEFNEATAKGVVIAE